MRAQRPSPPRSVVAGEIPITPKLVTYHTAELIAYREMLMTLGYEMTPFAHEAPTLGMISQPSTEEWRHGQPHARACAVQLTLRGAPPFHWGPEEDTLLLATRVSDEEVEAMIEAMEEDGWGAWIG